MIWDQRYNTDEYVYGEAANDFLISRASCLSPGNALCLAEGEGRNAVWLAEQGFTVTAVDSSATGLEKAAKLAASRNVSIELIHKDLAEFQIEADRWDLIVSIFAHTPANIRAAVHQHIAAKLRTGGLFILEAYRVEQLDYKTGGPPVADLMMDMKSLKSELIGLEFLHAKEVVREINEGKLHHGEGAVVQIVARKP